MERETHINGRPLFWVETKGWTLEETEELSQLYGLHALKLIRKIYPESRDFPLDILSVGDNWHQLTRFNPPYTEEGVTLYDLPEEPMFAVWPLRRREFASNGDGSLFILDSPVENFLLSTEMQVIKGKKSDERITERLGVIDFTSVGFPVFPDLEDLTIMPFPYSWGRRLFMTGFSTELFHVTDIRLQGKVQV